MNESPSPNSSNEGLLEACSLAREACRGAAASVAVVDEAAGELVYLAAVGPGAGALIGTRLPLSRGVSGFVASSGVGLVISDVGADPRFAADVARSTGYVPSTLLAVPIRSRTTAIGVLAVLGAERHDLDAAATIAASVAERVEAAAPGRERS